MRHVARGWKLWSQLALIVAAVSASPLRLWAADDDNIVESLEVISDGSMVTIPVRIADTEHPFILDTGATISVFDESLQGTMGPLRWSLLP